MTDSPSSLIETTAKAIYDADPIIATDGSVVVPWELPTGDAVAAHDPGRHRIVCDQARAALLAIKSHAAENGNFALLGDGWVICRNKEPEPITDTERAEIDRRLFQDAVRVVEATGTHVVMGIQPCSLPGRG